MMSNKTEQIDMLIAYQLKHLLKHTGMLDVAIENRYVNRKEKYLFETEVKIVKRRSDLDYSSIIRILAPWNSGKYNTFINQQRWSTLDLFWRTRVKGIARKVLKYEQDNIIQNVHKLIND
jgi:hypothetical protein